MAATDRVVDKTDWRNSGWVAFAGILFILVAIWNIFYGLGLLLKDQWTAINGEGLLVLDVTSWGWIILITGGVKLLTGVGLLTGQEWARIVAIILVVFNMVEHMVFATANPVWSLLIIAVNGVILFSLVVPRGGSQRFEGYWDLADRPAPSTIPR